jgi:hypothetical protein
MRSEVDSKRTRSDLNCAGTRVDGERCQSRITGQDGYCFAHSPDRGVQRTEARRLGGRRSSNLHRARRLAPPVLLDVFEKLESALREVHDGELSASRGQAMATMARALCSVMQIGQLEERLRRLEAQV